MDHDGMREYLNSPYGDLLRTELDRHIRRAQDEVLRLASAKQYDSEEVRYRAGVVTGMSLMKDVMEQLRKAPDAEA